MRRLTLLIVVAAVASSPLVAAASPTVVPDLTLQSADGTSVALSAYRGKVVLLDFWASWCPPCKTSFPALDTIFREYEARGVEVFAVNLDERRGDADAFLRGHPHRMTVLFDPAGVSPVAFRVKAMPSSFVIDKAGNIRFTHMGYSDSVDHSYRLEIDQLLAER